MSAERWTYAGRRELSGGKLAGAWIDPSGEERLFMGKHRVIGHRYEIPVVERGSDDRISANIGDAVYVDDGASVDRAQLAEWIARDAAAYAASELRKAEVRAKRDGGLGQLTLDELREQMGRLPPMQRTALLAAILRHVAI